MKQYKYYIGLILVGLILSLMSASCSPYGRGCDGNKKMLTAGAGRTKFKK